MEKLWNFFSGDLNEPFLHLHTRLSLNPGITRPTSTKLDVLSVANVHF